MGAGDDARHGVRAVKVPPTYWASAIIFLDSLVRSLFLTLNAFR